MRRLFGITVLAIMLAAATGLWAQDGATAPPAPSTAEQQATAPSSSNSTVARLSVMTGSVTTQRGDTGDWTAGALNTPLVTGDKVAAGQGSRTEIQIDYADILRLSDNSQANLANLSANQIQVQVAQGLVDYVVLKNAQAASEIDTPNVGVHPNGPGVFRIQVVSDSESQITVREGSAEISTPQGSTNLKKGEMITVQGTETPEYKISDAAGEDAWDQWNNSRDHIATEAQSLQRTNPYYTGVQDLDGYGYWTYVPGYGQVWVPNQAPGWAPYSVGSWDWEPYWGWTWASYEPWGWAPYHYGRWFWYGANWAWWPGPITPFYRPIWAPAYVSFWGFGGGFGFGAGFGFGHVGWLALGPGDFFHPWWGRAGFVGAPLFAGRGGFSNVALMRTDAHVRGGFVMEGADHFGNGRLVTRESVSAADIGRMQAIHGSEAMPAATRAGMRASDRPVNSAAMPHNAATHFFSDRAAASRPGAAGFSGDARGSAAAAGGTRAGWQRFNANTGAGAAAAGREGGNTGSNGMQRFSRSENVAPNVGARGASPQAEARPGWQRFTPQSGEQRQQQGRGYSPSNEGSKPSLNIGHNIVNPPANNSRYSPPASSNHSYVGGGGSSGGGRPSYGGGGGHVGGGGGGHVGGGGGHAGGGHHR